MKGSLKAGLIVGLLVPLIMAVGMASQWTGYWGGEKGNWNNQFYYNTRIYPMGPPSYQQRLSSVKEYQRWEWERPICYEFVDTPVHKWTPEGKAVARLAIEEWNQVISPLQGRIFEKDKGECRDRPADISIRWEDKESFFHNWGDPNRDGFFFNAVGAVGMFVPSRIAPPFEMNPCADLIAAGFLEKGNVVVLNSSVSWFVDSTPEMDEEFEEVSRYLCGVTRRFLKARRGGPAYGKWDLFTVFAHEFGHALGLIHSGGCDGKPWTPRTCDLSDDDGSLMWGGPLETKRDYLEDLYIGFGERRYVELELRPSVGKPDLIVEDITYEIKRVKVYSPPMKPFGISGYERTITVFATITNQGSVPAPASLVQAIRSLGMSFRHVPGLAPGGSIKIKVAEATVKSKGMYMVTVTVDPSDEIDEENEDNNTMTKMILLL